MENNVSRQSTCSPVLFFSTGHTVVAATVPPSPLYCRGQCHTVLFVSICVYCLSSLVIFNFCNALQVDCWRRSPLGRSRSGRGPLNAMHSSGRPHATSAPDGRGENTVDSRWSWRPSQLVSLRPVRVHHQEPENTHEPINFTEKDGENNFNVNVGSILRPSRTSKITEAGEDSRSKQTETDLPVPRRGLDYVEESREEPSKIRLQKVKTAGDINFSFVVNRETESKQATSNALLWKDNSGGRFSFPVDVGGRAHIGKSPHRTYLRRKKTERDFNFSLEQDGAEKFQGNISKVRSQTPRKSKFGSHFNIPSGADDGAELRHVSPKAPVRKDVNREDSNVSLDFNDEVERALLGSKEHSQKGTNAGDLHFSLPGAEGSKSKTATTKAPSRKRKTEGDFDLFSDVDDGIKSKKTPTHVPSWEGNSEVNFRLSSGAVDEVKSKQRQSQGLSKKEKREGDFDFSLDVDEGASKTPYERQKLRKTPTKVSRWEDGTERDYNFSLDFNNEATSKVPGSKVPGSKVPESRALSQGKETAGDLGFSLDIDGGSISEKRTAKAPLWKERTGGDLKFPVDAGNRTKPASASSNVSPWEDDTRGNFVLPPDAKDRLKSRYIRPKELPKKDETEDDFNFSPGVGEGTKRRQAASKTVEGRKKPRQTPAKVPPWKDGAGEDFDFSVDLSGEAKAGTKTSEMPPRKDGGAGDFKFSVDLDKQTKPEETRHKGPRQKREQADNFDFSFDVGSPENASKSPAAVPENDDETETYTLLDEEEDFDEDEEGSSKAGEKIDASAQTKPRFKLTGVSEAKQGTRQSRRKRTTTPVKKSAEEGSEFQREFTKDTVPVSLPAATLPRDSWHKLDTTASSADFVASLEAERARRQEAQNALEEKRLDAPPLTSMYTRAVKTVPATNYLGVGYDAVKGNPLGDPTMMADPGLRSPIISFEFEQSRYGVTNDLSTLQPLGAYTRPFAACRQSEAVSELNTLDDYQKELTVDASMEGGDALGLNRFSGSVGYQNFAKELSSKETKSYLLKTYCIRYEAGIAQTPSFKWNYTLAFQDAVSHLPTSFDGQGGDAPCNVLQWRQDSTVDACVNTNIPTWMDFIQQFGTHYVVRLFAGGKMTYQVALKSSDVSKLKKKGVDIKAELKLMLGGFGGQASSSTQFSEKSASNVKSLDIEKETLVIGGRPPGNISDPAAMARWADTVDVLPMPVKVELQSLGGLLPEEKRNPFERAAKYYGKVYGMSVQDLQVLELAPKELPEVLRSATQVAWAGPPPGYAKCPDDTVVLFGYAMKLNFNLRRSDDMASYFLVACAAGREKCDGVGRETQDDDDERIFVVCGKETLHDLYQVVAISPTEDQQVAVATCPEETVVVLGFGLAVATGDLGAERVELESCHTGQTICTKNVGAGTNKSFVWAVCAEKSYPGIMNLSNVVQVDSRGPTSKKAKHRDGLVTVVCPQDESILLGFALEAHTHMPDVRETYTTCDKGESTCSLQGAGVDTAIFGRDHHSLLSWIVCSPKEKEVSHAVTENPERGQKYETQS